MITTRIYAEPTDQMLKEINQAVKEKGIGKTQIVLEALDQYLHGSDPGELAAVRGELGKAKSDLNQNWTEITRLRGEITALKADLDKARSLAEKLQGENQTLREGSDQARSEADALRRDQDHYKDTLALKDKQIAFLEGHVSQLSQTISQLALPPGQEEAKKKGWSWQFWK